MSPVKLCCGQPHEGNGPICPDGRVMCCMCFDRVEQNDLASDPDDIRILTDVCKSCAAMDGKWS